MCTRLTYSDKASSVIYKLRNSCDYIRIGPVLTTAMSSIRITYIYDNIYIRKNIFILKYVFKTDELNIKRCTG